MMDLIPSILTAPGHDPQRVLQDQGLVILIHLSRRPGFVQLLFNAGAGLFGSLVLELSLS